MRAKEIKKLKELSAEVVRMYSGLLPRRGTRDKLAELNEMIQAIEGRKTSIKQPAAASGPEQGCSLGGICSDFEINSNDAGDVSVCSVTFHPMDSP